VGAVVRVRLLPMVIVVLLIIVGFSAGVVTSAPAAQWPAEQQFSLVEPPVSLNMYPPPSSVAETPDGALLVLIHWPVTRTSEDGLGTEWWFRTRLVRIAPDGSRAFVPPFGELEPGSSNSRINVDDEILPLPDGSILFTRYNAIDLLRRDGSIVRFAGTGRYSDHPSGDGGPATAADVGFAHGLTRLPDGSILFADSSYGQVRRIAPDGTITTIAGSGEFGFGGDGGPATAAQLRGPGDVLPTRDGGFLIADTYNGRVRRVSPRGVISTVAGVDKSDISASFGDGRPAIAAALALPEHLERLPDGSLLIGGWDRIRRVSRDGTISTLFELPEGPANRLGDFAGRYGETIEAMGVTEEGGIAVILAGFHLRAVYLAPPKTNRTLVALRAARASQRRVRVTVDATRAGSLRLQVRRHGKMVVRATRHVEAGRQVIAVSHNFAAAYHGVHVTLRTKRGGSYRDHIRLFASQTLPERLVVPALGSVVRACQRVDSRRIDCEIHDPDDEEDGRPCLNTSAYRLLSSGLLFTRPYGRACHHKPIPFDRSPNWTAPWRAWPPR
jgi:hypothetical protein